MHKKQTSHSRAAADISVKWRHAQPALLTHSDYRRSQQLFIVQCYDEHRRSARDE